MFSQVYFFHPIAAILFLAAISGISLICCPFCPLIFCIETVIYSAMAFLQMTQIYMKMVCFVLEQRETDILFSSFRCGLPQSHGAPQFNVYTSFLQSYWFGFTHRSRDCLSSAFVLIFFFPAENKPESSVALIRSWFSGKCGTQLSNQPFLCFLGDLGSVIFTGRTWAQGSAGEKRLMQVPHPASHGLYGLAHF